MQDVPKQKTYIVQSSTYFSRHTKTCKHRHIERWILIHARMYVDMHRQRITSKMHTGRNIMSELAMTVMTAYYGPGTVLGTTYMLPHLILQTSTHNLGGQAVLLSPFYT